MRDDYEQMELDTRRELDKAIADLAVDAISTAQQMILNCGEGPQPVRNRHEAYGIAAEQLANISGAVKAIKNDTDTLLGTLGDPNYPAVEATSSIVNSTVHASFVLLRAAAEMRRTLDNLYMAENSTAESTPMDDYMDGIGEFAEADPADADEE